MAWHCASATTQAFTQLATSDAHYKAQILACDFFTIETLFLRTVYVLFFIELQIRRVYFAGCTTYPDGPWVRQQARHMVWQLEERQPSVHFLIHDRDSKFVAAFDTVFQSTGAHVIRTPFRAPNANAYAERWVRSVQRECLNKLIVLKQAHLWFFDHMGLIRCQVV